MKKNYILSSLASLLLSGFAFAQTQISFESSEGFTLTSIHTQNAWEVSEGSDGVLQNQIISDEQASDRSFSFKNSHEDAFGSQWLPIFGAAKAFDTPRDYKDLVISYDIYITEKNGADFEFTAYAEGQEVFSPVAGIGLENRGYIYVIVDENYGTEYTDESIAWNINTWHNIKIEITENNIKYYLDNNLIYTGNNFTQLDVYGINMLHNNYGGSAYYDNINIEEGTLNTQQNKLDSFSFYPNPAKDYIHITSAGNSIENVKVFSITGKEIINSVHKSFINTSALNKGTYLLEVTQNGNTTRKLFIKE